MNTQHIFTKSFLVVVMAIVLTFGISKQVLAADEEASAALLSALSLSKVSLSEAIKQSAKGIEAPISAKYELDEKGKLSLSVYTAEKGLEVGSQNNVFHELSASPESDQWSPKSEIIKGQGDLKDAEEQLAVLSKAKVPLVDMIQKASKENQGTVFSVMPEMENNHSVIEVKLVHNGKVSEHHYDSMSGNDINVEERDEKGENTY